VYVNVLSSLQEVLRVRGVSQERGEFARVFERAGQVNYAFLCLFMPKKHKKA
jgi:hypothetical protein